MSIVEIRCPRCGSPSHLKDEKKHEYQCSHCEATFRFVDTTKKEVIYDTRAHNCPICGRSVKAGEGHICTECGKKFLCNRCIDEIRDYETRLERIICKECLKGMGLMCGDLAGCSNQYQTSCVVCRKQYCDEHASYHIDFKIPTPKEMRKDFKQTLRTGYSSWRPFALYCSNCGGYLCRHCCTEKTSFFGGKRSFYCGKCGSKLTKMLPFDRKLFDSYY